MAPRPPAADLRLGFLERLRLLPIFAAVLGKTFWSALTAKLRSRNQRPASFTRMLGYTALRTLGTHNTSRTEQYDPTKDCNGIGKSHAALAPGTDESYLAYCKRFNVQPATETLKDGTNAYWVGSKGAQKVLIYFHGGGYSLPAAPEHFSFLHSLVTDLDPHTTGGLAALVLHYDVAPFASYPRQLSQAAQLLNHVLRVLRFAPCNIIVSGDSAGGNLALALLSHVLHPHPDAAAVPRVVLKDFSTEDADQEGELLRRTDSAADGGSTGELATASAHGRGGAAGGDGGGGGGGGGGGAADTGSGTEAAPQPLLAVVLISPWVSFDTATRSFATNRTRDMIGPSAITRWSTLFLGGHPTDPYNEPVDVPAGWWKGLDAAVRDVLFLAGEYEILLDGILNCVESVRNEWGRKAGGSGGEVACVVVRDEGHVSCWADTLFGFKNEELKMYIDMREWLKTRV